MNIIIIFNQLRQIIYVCSGRIETLAWSILIYKKKIENLKKKKLIISVVDQIQLIVEE